MNIVYAYVHINIYKDINTCSTFQYSPAGQHGGIRPTRPVHCVECAVALVAIQHRKSDYINSDFIRQDEVTKGDMYVQIYKNVCINS